MPNLLEIDVKAQEVQKALAAALTVLEASEIDKWGCNYSPLMKK